MLLTYDPRMDLVMGILEISPSDTSYSIGWLLLLRFSLQSA